jgi:hypothetical protein
MRELVRREQKDRLREQLEQRLLEGLNSGEGVESTPEMWRDLHQGVRELARNMRRQNR